MEKKGLGPFLLSGLMIGPVLGSGVILLPPMIYKQIGPASIWAWIIIMILGGFFAAIFARLALEFPGKEGVYRAVGIAFGPNAGQLASNFIISAVSVGPVAVLATAATEISKALNRPDMIPAISGVMLIFCILMLLRNISDVGKISLICSSLVAIILILGSILTIISAGKPSITDFNVAPLDFGKGLLLLFWTIIGWELLGNYSTEVKNPRKTIPRAAIISVFSISLIYILIGLAINTCQANPPGITEIVRPVLGRLSPFVISAITIMLCTSTYLMIVGGITRLVNSLAMDRRLPAFLRMINKNGSPSNAVFLYGGIHFIVILLLQFNILDLEQIIAFANVFFLSNALICIFASLSLINSIMIKISGGILSIGFMILFYFSSPWILSLMAAISIATLFRNKIFATIQFLFPERDN